jgi:hypothetical protein
VQLLPISFRTINPTFHKKRFQEIVQSLRSTFLPVLDEPLTVAAALQTTLEQNSACSAFNGPIAAGTGYMFLSLGDQSAAETWFSRALDWYSSLDYVMADWQQRDCALVKRLLASLRYSD